jgi:putative SbcD/Mre11-related phosphoesterase
LTETEFLFGDRALLISTGHIRHLVIADVHIGFESRFAREGVRLQPSISKMQDNIHAIISRFEPQHVVVLGDVKSGTESITDAEWKLVPEFFRKVAAKAEVTVVPGNHDGGLLHLLPASVQLASMSGVILDDTFLTHGHTNIPEGEQQDISNLAQIVMAHVHPTFNQKGSPLSGQPVWILLKVSRKTYSEAGVGSFDLTVMPSFNPELSHYGYSALHEKNISPILRRAKEHITKAAVITLNGDIVGEFATLKYVLPSNE